MLKILINSYACSPHTGSEPGMGWNWCANLAKYCEVHVITEGEFKYYIEEALKTLPQASNMHFYYNPVSKEVRKMCWNQGDWRFYKHYRLWQKKTLEIARVIIEKESIDIVHQLNMIGFREPGYLWKLDNVPIVWGPVDAKESFPESFLNQADYKTRIFTKLKNRITKFQLKHSARVKRLAEKASLVIAASSNSQESFKKFLNIEAKLINETGCYIKEENLNERSSHECLNLLWVGKFDFRKQLNLAIKTLAELSNKNVRLHIVGDGNSLKFKELAQSLGVENLCVWYGLVSHAKVQELMKTSDLLFFTSVAEGTPHVVLESISNHLPIICFNTCGQGDIVNEDIGFKIPLSNPERAIKDFSRIINSFVHEKDKLVVLSHNCMDYKLKLSWDYKSREVVSLYKFLTKSV